MLSSILRQYTFLKWCKILKLECAINWSITVECTMGNLEYDKIPISVFPVPGGPNKRIPLGGERSPVNISGLSNGKTTISFTVFFTKSNPAISFQSVGFPLNKISKK